MSSSAELLTAPALPWAPPQLGGSAAAPGSPHLAEAVPSSGESAASDTQLNEEWHPMFGAAQSPSNPNPDDFELSNSIGIPEIVLRAARKEGYAKGYAEGLASGRAEAAQEADRAEQARALELEQEKATARRTLESTCSALGTAAEGFQDRAASDLDSAQEAIVGAAFEIAEALVGVTLRDDELRGAAAIRRVLALVPEEADAVKVSLHPNDLALLISSGVIPRPSRRAGDNPRAEGAAPTTTSSLIAALGPMAASPTFTTSSGAVVTFLEDATLTPGDAFAITETTVVDGRVAPALARLREALR